MSEQGKYTADVQSNLLLIAKQSIEHGLEAEQQPLSPHELLNSATDELQATLVEMKGVFVTLEKSGRLRGCIGSLQPQRPLAADVAVNASNAAFRDPRFPALQADELNDLTVSISVLTTPEPMRNCQTQESFLAQVQPHKDGIIISDGSHRATFLPSVWQQLPDKNQFISHLMQKAGIKAWSENMQCERYHSIGFSAEWNDIAE